MPSIQVVSRHSLFLSGWERESTWGWDPGQYVWYAQLWLDGTKPGGNNNEDGPVLWLTPPLYVLAERGRLIDHLTDFLCVDDEPIVRAFIESYERDEDCSRGPDAWEPEPPLTGR